MIKFVKKVCAVAALTAVSGLSWAGDADEALKSLLDRYQGFSADFSQIASADQGQRVQENTGHLSVQKPNQFRWISNEPYPQEIVGDGQHIWIYDPDLEQVTRKAAQNGSTSAPALILNGQIDELHVEAGGRVRATVVSKEMSISPKGCFEGERRVKDVMALPDLAETD